MSNKELTQKKMQLEIDKADKHMAEMLAKGQCTECESLKSMKQQGSFGLWRYCPYCGKELERTMQMSIFDDNPIFVIDKPVRLVELFAGIGSQAKAMSVLERFFDIEWEKHIAVEWQQKSIDSYNAVHHSYSCENYKDGYCTEEPTYDDVVENGEVVWVNVNRCRYADQSDDEDYIPGQAPYYCCHPKLDKESDEYGRYESPLDITTVTCANLDIEDTDKYCYIMTYSFPCQDLSLAGLQKGMKKDSGTRSGLLWEVERLLKECYCDGKGELPQVLVMENVPQVRTGKNEKEFEKLVRTLEKLGYSNFVQDLNAKDYGIPQNRERTFMVSILGKWRFEFPQPRKLHIVMADILQQQVDPKYYIDDSKIKNVLTSNFSQRRANIQDKEYCDILLARDWKDPKCVIVGELDVGESKGFVACNSIYDSNGLSPTLKAQGNNNILKIQEPKCVVVAEVDSKSFGMCNKVYDSSGLSPTLLAQGNSSITKILESGNKQSSSKNQLRIKGADTIRCKIAGYLDNEHQLEMHNRVYDPHGLSPTLTTQSGGNIEKKIQELSGRVRKLTPREYWRLMGFEDSDFDKVERLQSKTTLYTQAGDSICVGVLIVIFGELLGLDTSEVEYDTKKYEYRLGKEVNFEKETLS